MLLVIGPASLEWKVFRFDDATCTRFLRFGWYHLKIVEAAPLEPMSPSDVGGYLSCDDGGDVYCC